MNRRNFFKTLTGAVVGFTILPPATTYERVWKVARGPFELVSFADGLYSYLLQCRDAYYLNKTPLTMNELFKAIHAVKGYQSSTTFPPFEIRIGG